MVKISNEDSILVKNLRLEKHWGAKKMIKEFPNKHWKIRTINKLIRKINVTGSAARRVGSGRPKTVRTAVNIHLIEQLICSPPNVPRSHKSPRAIEREFAISRSSIRRIIKLDLGFHIFKRIPVQFLTDEAKAKRLQRSKLLLERFPTERSVRRIWFTDEKIFTVSPPRNAQNDRVYSHAAEKCHVVADRLLFQRSHFSKSVMVSVGVSRMGKTGIVFVEPGAKINSAYYCHQLLGNGLFPAIRDICGHHNWVLQQDGAPSHRAAKTVEFLHQEHVQFIEPDLWPPNSPDLNPVDYAVWGALEQQVYQHQIRDLTHLKEIIRVEWGKLSLRFVTRSINQWQRRLACVIQENGGHIEHLFK
jgi:hypothetical protein